MFIPLFKNPFLRFATDGEDGGGAPKSEDLGFPADTPFEDMTVEEKLAFKTHEADKWKGLSRKHEKNRKPEAFDADMAELAQFRAKQDESLKPDEKAIKDAETAARAAGRSEGVSKLLASAVRAEFKARAPHLTEEELTEFLEDIEVTEAKFYVNDELDTERIDRLASRIAKPEQEEGAPNVTLGGVLSRGTAQPKKNSGNARQAAYERTKARFPKSETN